MEAISINLNMIYVTREITRESKNKKVNVSIKYYLKKGCSE